MKNLNNDNIAQDQSHEDFFDRLPTAEEAERMEAEAGVTDTLAFNEQAVTALVSACMRKELAHTFENQQTGSSKRKGRRKIWRDFEIRRREPLEMYRWSSSNSKP